jgi:hypothetical protein
LVDIVFKGKRERKKRGGENSTIAEPPRKALHALSNWMRLHVRSRRRRLLVVFYS